MRDVTNRIASGSAFVPQAKPFHVPFLGSLTRQSASELQWEQQLLRHELAFLQCHRVGKVPLLPGTCYIEMARNMAVALHGSCVFSLARAVFESILFLDDTDLDGGPSVRLRLDHGDALVTISSRRAVGAWHSNASLALELRGASVAAVVAGESQWTITPGPAVAGLIKGGKLKALAVTSEKRSDLLPDVPAMIKAGVKDYVVNTWMGFAVPANTPAGETPAAPARRSWSLATRAATSSTSTRVAPTRRRGRWLY